MIYDYKCNECSEIFEVFATLAEKEKGLNPKCPKCSSKDTHQVISVFNIGGTSKKGGNMNPPMCGPIAGAGCC